MESATKIKLSREQINEITKRALDAKCIDFKELSDGWFNTAYDIALNSGRHAIVKVAPPADVKILSYEKDIMKTEVEVMRMVRSETDVPVPEIYTYDTSREIIGNDYYLMEKLKGVPYNYIQDKIQEDKREAIETRLGEYNRQINDISGDKFGLYSDVHEKFDTWYAAFYYMMRILLEDAQDINLDIGRPYEKILDIAASLKDALDEVKKPDLVHWDLWSGNLFVDNGEITGIIDFERALWGDRLMEVFLHSGESAYFTKGYGTDISGGAGAEARKRLYRLYLGIVMVVEAPYRNYNKEHEQWVASKFEKAYEEVTKLI